MKHRMTPARAAISEIFESEKSPISVPQILKLLRNKKLNVNKTTVYREISHLLSEDKICEVTLSPHVVHYESADLAHHHHLVCDSCGKIEELVCEELETPMQKLERRVANKFKIKEHNLEFYGTCAGCF